MTRPTVVHLADPADGLPACATARPNPTVSDDPADVTCTRCLDA